jgi:3-isopropylmalate/(R)-2-methylmalate dehydratase small subunit
MNPITQLTARTLVLRDENIDTDQIIPARFLTTTTRTGLGKSAFYDWRYDAQGNERADSVLNSAAAKQAGILVSGRNFGCGSSREHAPWALLDMGFRAVISSEIADIFRSNSLKNGLLALVIAPELHRQLLERPGIELAIDLETQTIRGPDGWVANFELDQFSNRCLMLGVDQLGYLMHHEAAIAAYEQRVA